VRQDGKGTKACLWYQLVLGSGERRVLQFRLHERPGNAPAFDLVLRHRMEEADEFYSFAPDHLSEDGRRVQRQAFAGLLWSKQFYHYWCTNGSMATRPSRRLPRSENPAATAPGTTFITTTCW